MLYLNKRVNNFTNELVMANVLLAALLALVLIVFGGGTGYFASAAVGQQHRLDFGQFK